MDSLSGSGSNLLQTEAVRRALPLLMQELACKTILDVPCGDYFWMKLVKMNAEYIGGDIVDKLVEDNKRQYEDSSHRFIHLDLIRDDLPAVDLILCRDCMVHLSYEHAFCALRNIKRSGSQYLLTTTFVERARNENIATGDWRPINLEIPPFSLPAPIRVIDEECTEDECRDKHLGLWRVYDIPDF